MGSEFDSSALLSVEMVVRVIVQILLLCGSAFFSGSEVALFSVTRLDLEQLRRERSPKAGILYSLLDQPRRLIISILCGNELINVAASANMAVILVQLADVENFVLLNLLIMVPLLLLFGEVTPKTIAISNPVKVSTKIVASPMNAWVKLVSPLRWVIRLISDKLTTFVVGDEKSPENILHVDEVRTLAKELEQSGELQLEERVLVDTLLEAGAKEVAEIMVPRTHAHFIAIDTPVPDALESLRTYRHSRVPVYRDHRDNLVGFLHAEDFLELAVEGADLEQLKLIDLLHPVIVVPPTKPIDDMLDFLRTHRAQAAAVVNEFGGVDGIVTMRTIVDFMFDPVCGRSPLPGRFQAEDSYEVAGDMKLDLFNDLTNYAISDPRMITIAGVVFRHLDRLPEVGDTVTFDGITFEVLEMAGHGIGRLRARRAEATVPGDASP